MSTTTRREGITLSSSSSSSLCVGWVRPNAQPTHKPARKEETRYDEGMMEVILLTVHTQHHGAKWDRTKERIVGISTPSPELEIGRCFCPPSPVFGSGVNY